MNWQALFNIYLPPVIIVLGIAGNISSLIIYSRQTSTISRHMRFHFRLLSIVDLISIVQFIPFWLNSQFDMDLKSKSNLACKMLMLLLFIPSSISAWVQVVISAKIVCLITNTAREKEKLFKVRQ